MKNIVLYLGFILLFTNVQAKEFSEENKTYIYTKKMAKDTRHYSKYVYAPLEKFSSEITSGTLSFRMSITKNEGEAPLVYNCNVEFSRWPATGTVLPSMVLSVNDSLLYVIHDYKLYTFDLITGDTTIGDIKAATSFVWDNPFLSFYTYWYNLGGKVDNVSIVKEGNTVFSTFEVVLAQEADNTGYYQLAFQPKKGLLTKYAYKPAGKEKFDFYNMECELIEYHRSISPVALMKWMYLIK
ncbi:MAG: hypothetical protein LBI60_06830 [Bacteroidales bacterium]|jgi:hypothetical protein|nr:hypothetical protein [Bacteroidales bacterium]